jgi:LmbE family N-acetylglucosaminyl deacetylase
VTPSVAAIVAHPDDETLIAGGTLALAADAGALTGAVALTRGELGPIADPALATRETLAEVREGELAAAARELGLDWTACLGYPDGELAWADADVVATELAALLRPHAPTIVLTFGADGVYGHPDHAGAREHALRAVERLAAEGTANPAVYETVWAPDVVPGLAAAARKRGLPTALWGLEPEAFGSDDQLATVAVDVLPALDRRARALRAHATQFGPDHLLSALPGDLAERHLGAESWRLARAGAAGGDALDRLLAPHARAVAAK